MKYLRDSTLTIGALFRDGQKNLGELFTPLAAKAHEGNDSYRIRRKEGYYIFVS